MTLLNKRKLKNCFVNHVKQQLLLEAITFISIQKLNSWRMGFKCVYWGLGEKFFLKYRIRIMFQHPFAEAGCNLNPSGNQSIKKKDIRIKHFKCRSIAAYIFHLIQLCLDLFLRKTYSEKKTQKINMPLSWVTPINADSIYKFLIFMIVLEFWLYVILTFWST